MSLVQCQYSLCGEWFESRTGKAKCCSPICYMARQDEIKMICLQERLNEACRNDKSHTQLLSQ